ncbi:DUF6544 family protein [Daejeonella lutea]|uniref:DUF6544 family protein n=1 Tax=Daejeonella lutea TaxID=572036 RepID=UPI0009A8C86E|nr:DUF6544 family protein [Daejeonella lutea]
MVSTAAVADNITWENTGPYSAKATMTYMVANTSGIFTFSPESDFIGFEALRNYNRPEGATLRTWVILVPADGLRICRHTYSA